MAFLFAGGNATSVFNNNGDLVLAPTTSNNTVIINNDIVFDGSSLRDIIQQLLAETAELRSALRWSTFNLPSDHPISDFPSEFGGNLASACAVYFNDAVYVFEGNSTARYLLNTSDMRGTWSILADMPMNLIQCSAIAFDSRIWIVGGMKSNQAVNTTLSFDPVSHSFRTEASLHRRRRRAGLALCGMDLCAVGGFDAYGSPSVVSSFERYNPTSKTWSVKDFATALPFLPSFPSSQPWPAYASANQITFFVPEDTFSPIVVDLVTGNITQAPTGYPSRVSGSIAFFSDDTYFGWSFYAGNKGFRYNATSGLWASLSDTQNLSFPSAQISVPLSPYRNIGVARAMLLVGDGFNSPTSLWFAPTK